MNKDLLFKAIKEDLECDKNLSIFLESGGMLPGFILSDRELSEEEIERIKSVFKKCREKS